MIIYNYGNNGAYLGMQEFDLDPVQDNAFLMPFNSTRIKPPVTGEYQIAIFENNGWRIKSNYVGIAACEIDENSIYVQAHTFTIGEVLSSTIILATPPITLFYKTKWNGTTWIEGATQAEIDAIIANKPKTMSEMQVSIDASVDAINYILMNF